MAFTMYETVGFRRFNPTGYEPGNSSLYDTGFINR
jgi:hypothetical protein